MSNKIKKLYKFGSKSRDLILRYESLIDDYKHIINNLYTYTSLFLEQMNVNKIEYNSVYMSIIYIGNSIEHLFNICNFINDDLKLDYSNDNSCYVEQLLSNNKKPSNGQSLKFKDLNCIRHWRNYIAHYMGISNYIILGKIQAPECNFASLFLILKTLKEEIENSDIFNDRVYKKWHILNDLDYMQTIFKEHNKDFLEFSYPRK